MANNDILQKLQNPEPIDWSTYKAPGESSYVRPPVPVDKEGKRLTFEGILPPVFTYEANPAGELVVSADPIVLKGSDYKIRFTKISGKQFVRDNGAKSSFLANFVKAVSKDARPQTWQDYMRLIDTFGRRPFKFTADWEAYDKETQTTVAKGYKNFPLDKKVNDGFTRTPWVNVAPDGKVLGDDATEEQLKKSRRVFANLKVANYIAVK
jgi:hypothetical protein